MDIAVVNAPRYAVQDVETPALVNALNEAGLSATLVPWYGTGVAFSEFRLVVVKSPWDCDSHEDDFLAWLSRLEEARARVLNPPSVLRWNFDKHYLGDLSKAGVPVIPTTFLEPGAEPSFPAGEFVVKPVVSGGARNTARYRSGEHEAARQHVRLLHGMGASVMVQPYAEAIDTVGERALVFYNGRFDHAIRKDAILKPGVAFDVEGREAHPNPVPHEPTSAELFAAEQALLATPWHEPLLYARIDLTQAADGSPLIMELELLNPVLFFELSPGSLARYVDAIAAHL